MTLEPDRTRALPVDRIAIGAGVLTVGVFTTSGGYHPVALALVVIGGTTLLLALWPLGKPNEDSTVARRLRMVYVVQILVLGMSLLRHVDTTTRGGGALLVLYATAYVLLAASGWFAIGDGTLARVMVPVAVAAFVLLAGAVVAGHPTRINDVRIFQEMGAQRLVDGVNPYAPGYPDIYPPEESAAFYGPGLSEDGVLKFGFPYPPLSLLLVIPGALLGDLRWVNVVVVAVCALLVWRAGGENPVTRAGTILFLSISTWLFVLVRSWTEPLVILMLVLAAILARARPGTRGVAAGMLALSKQYAVLFLPLLGRFYAKDDDGSALRVTVMAFVATTAIITIPFLLWSPSDFWDSVVVLQFRQPFRPDALSIAALLANETSLPSIVAALLFPIGALAALFVAFRRAPGTPAGFALAVSVTAFGLVVFAKQAFANYYLVVAAAAYVAVALEGAGPTPVPIRDNGDYAE